MERIEGEPFRLARPALADELVWGKAFEGLQATTEVVGGDEVIEVTFKLLMTVVVIALDGGLLDGAVHSLDLAIRPGMIDFGETVLDAVFSASQGEHVSDELRGGAIGIAWRQTELDAVVGEHDMDFVRHGGDQRGQELRGGHPVGL